MLEFITDVYAVDFRILDGRGQLVLSSSTRHRNVQIDSGGSYTDIAKILGVDCSVDPDRIQIVKTDRIGPTVADMARDLGITEDDLAEQYQEHCVYAEVNPDDGAYTEWVERRYVRYMRAQQPPRPQPPVIHQVLDLSISHLPEWMRDDLNAHDGVHATRHPHGWWLYVPEHVADTARQYEVPDPIVAVWEYADRYSCRYVRLDRDGYTSDALTTYPTN